MDKKQKSPWVRIQSTGEAYAPPPDQTAPPAGTPSAYTGVANVFRGGPPPAVAPKDYSTGIDSYMLSDSPQMMNAKRASEIMNRMYNPGPGVVAPTPEELATLKAFQNRKIGL